MCRRVLQCVAVCFRRVLQCVAVCFRRVLQCVAVCVDVCCSVLQCVAVCLDDSMIRMCDMLVGHVGHVPHTEEIGLRISTTAKI